jgi:hypothetical protein
VARVLLDGGGERGQGGAVVAQPAQARAQVAQRVGERGLQGHGFTERRRRGG